MMIRKYGPIGHVGDLRNLQKECGDLCTAVGFTSGGMYVIRNDAAKAITDAEAKEILDVNDDELSLLKASEGRHVLHVEKENEEINDEPLEDVETNPEQFEVLEDDSIHDDPLSEDKFETVEITSDEYNRLLEIQERAEYLEDEVKRLTFQRDEAKEELELIKNSFKVIKNL